jgi:Ca2+-binding RTX toxin-like protein
MYLPGPDGDDDLIGTVFGHYMSDGLGDDSLVGLDGNDSIFGGTGNNV